jgi:integrase
MHSGKEVRERACDPKTGEPTFDLGIAQKFLKARLDSITTEKGGGPVFITPQVAKITIRELADALEADYTLRKKLSPQNKSHLKKLKADFGHYRATALATKQVNEYIAKRQAEDDADATINRVLQILSQCYTLAFRNEQLAKAPYIPHLTEDNTREDCFTEKQLATVIENLPADLHDLVHFAAACGRRKGEVCAYTWDMLKGSTLHIPKSITKNKKGGVLALAGETLEIIERQKARRSVKCDGVEQICRYIFHRDGETTPVGEFRKCWKTALRKAGLSGYRFHGLRRFAAVAHRDAGVPMVVSMKLTGHKTDSMWIRYSIVNEEDQRDGLEKTQEHRAKVVAMGK